MPMELGSVSAGAVDFVVRVDKKLWIEFGLFQNSCSFFGTQCTIFGSKGLDYTDGVALPDDAACYAVSLIIWCWDCGRELSCKVFSVRV